MRSLAAMMLLALMALQGSPLHAGLSVHHNLQVDYSWTESAFFSDDVNRLNTQVRVKVKPGSTYENQSALNGFLGGLNNPANQQTLKEAYRLNNKTYLVLARLAVGIMYAESKLGTHPRYLFKERFPWTVSIAKEYLDKSVFEYKRYGIAIDNARAGLALEYLALHDDSFDPSTRAATIFDLSENSRGPTQIKYLPGGFEKVFPNINKNNLRVPEFSSVATVAYLADAIQTLTRLAKKYNCEIPREYFLQHLLYVYVGRSSEIVNCTATLDKNVYWSRALEVQNSLNAYAVGSENAPLTRATQIKIEHINAEIKIRQARQVALGQIISLIKAMRDQNLTLKPEDANMMLEYLFMAGVTGYSHKKLNDLRKYLPTFKAWKQKNMCARLLLGRKRYYAALYGTNAALTYLMRNDPNFGYESWFELDDDKKRLIETEAMLQEETLIIKRLQLDIAILATEL
jgi:hypothetical protein